MRLVDDDTAACFFAGAAAAVAARQRFARAHGPPDKCFSPGTSSMATTYSVAPTSSANATPPSLPLPPHADAGVLFGVPSHHPLAWRTEGA